MLTRIAKLTVKAGHEQEFERMIRIVIPKVRQEPGNHAYVFHRSTQDPRLFMCYEEYEDQAALEAHCAHLRLMDIDLQALLDGPPTIEFYDRVV